MVSSSFIVFSNTSSSWVFNMFCPAFFYYMFPIIFISFLRRFLHHFLWFPAFSYLFNININPRVLPVSFIFRSLLHHFPSLLSHFLRFHCIFPACLLHRHGLRLAFAPVSSIFQGIFHGLFLAFAPFSSVFQGILYDFLWSLSCFPAVSLYFPIHPHGLSGHQKGGPRGNRYPTVSKLPSGT